MIKIFSTSKLHVGGYKHGFQAYACNLILSMCVVNLETEPRQLERKQYVLFKSFLLIKTKLKLNKTNIR